MTLKQFIDEYSPTEQSEIKNFNKYLLPYVGTAKAVALICKHYSSRIFTGTREDNKLILRPGKLFSLENSFHIITTKEIEDLENDLIIEL